MQKPWRRLPLTKLIRSAPPLLVQANFTDSSYKIYITDLSKVWIEKLSSADVLARAAQLNTTIDPSDDASQLPILLEKLEVAVCQLSREGTVELTSTCKGDLQLRIQHELPGNLPDLEWIFFLRSGTTIDFTNLFLLPLISFTSSQVEKIDSLLGIIKEKDYIVNKLVGKLEESKVDPKTIIRPGKRKGLEIFIQESWEKEMKYFEERRPAEVVGDVFYRGISNDASSIRPFNEEVGKWVLNIEDNDGTSVVKKSEDLTSYKEQDSPIITVSRFVETESDDEPKITKRAVLGKIGGKNTVSIKHLPRSPSPTTNSYRKKSKSTEAVDGKGEQSKSPQERVLGKIGNIGGQKKIQLPPLRDLATPVKLSIRAGSEPETANPPYSPPKIISPESDLEPEDEDERADHRRKQLEKELEAKKKTHKKKRKF